MKKVKIICIILLLFNAIGALPAGFLFIIDPTGSKMGMNTHYLQHSPFNTFLIPGIVLFMVNGVYSLLTAYFTYKSHPKSVLMVMAQGSLLLGWIIIQVLMLQMTDALHYIMGTVGFMLLVLGFLLYKNK
ncbi:MAG: hypothetical protein J0L87_12450 [Bacteroidetes bacterium]|nr:hypothetical protein [Bacteroidota bacterium]